MDFCKKGTLDYCVFCTPDNCCTESGFACEFRISVNVPSDAPVSQEFSAVSKKVAEYKAKQFQKNNQR